MKKTSSLHRDAIWSFGTTVLDRGGVLLLTVIIAQFLGANALGVFGLISVTVMTVINPFAYALTTAGTRRVAETYEHQPSQAISIIIIIVAICILLSFIFGMFFLITPDFIATNILNRADLSTVLVFGSVLVVGELLRKVGLGIFHGLKAFKEAFLSAIWFFVTISFAIFFVEDFGIKGVLILNGVAGVVFFIFGLYLVSRRYLIQKANNFKFSYLGNDNNLFLPILLPAFLASLVPGVIVWYMQVLLVQHGDTIQLGFFSAANQIRMMIVFFPVILSSILIPRMVKKVGQIGGDSSDVSYLIISLVGSAVIVIILGLVLSVLSPWIVHIYGKEFLDQTSLFNTMIWVGCFNGINQSLGSIIIARGSVWVGFISNSLWAALMASIFIFFGDKSLAISMADAMLYSYIMITIFQIIYVIRMSPELINYLKLKLYL